MIDITTTTTALYNFSNFFFASKRNTKQQIAT